MWGLMIMGALNCKSIKLQEHYTGRIIDRRHTSVGVHICAGSQKPCKILFRGANGALLQVLVFIGVMMNFKHLL